MCPVANFITLKPSPFNKSKNILFDKMETAFAHIISFLYQKHLHISTLQLYLYFLITESAFCNKKLNINSFDI